MKILRQNDADSSIAQQAPNYRGQRGANFVEYVILMMLIAFVVIVIPRLMGERLQTQFSKVSEEFHP